MWVLNRALLRCFLGFDFPFEQICEGGQHDNQVHNFKTYNADVRRKDDQVNEHTLLLTFYPS
jgi:hypothetical protein